MKCKNCEKKEAVKYSKYSKGEFCSKECAKAYSTKSKRKEINKKVSKKLKGTKVSSKSLDNLEKGRKMKTVHSEDVRKKISNSLKGRSVGGRKVEKIYKVCEICSSEFYAGNRGNKETKKRKVCSRECAIKLSSKVMCERASLGLIKNKGIKCKYIFKGKIIKCDSKVEYACLDFFEGNYNVLEISRSKDIIEYEYEGKKEKYNPDFSILTDDGEFIVECKTIIKNAFLNDKWRKYNEVSNIKKEILAEYAKNKGIESFWFTKELHRKFYNSLKNRDDIIL